MGRGKFLSTCIAAARIWPKWLSLALLVFLLGLWFAASQWAFQIYGRPTQAGSTQIRLYVICAGSLYVYPSDTRSIPHEGKGIPRWDILFTKTQLLPLFWWPLTKQRVTIVPLWVPVLAVALATIALFWISRRRQFPKGCCRRCGYDLTGNVTGVCPECGHATAATDTIR